MNIFQRKGVSSANDFRNLGFPGAEDLGNMFQVKRDFETQYCSNRDLNLAVNSIQGS
jgi:hypothetical protein